MNTYLLKQFFLFPLEIQVKGVLLYFVKQYQCIYKKIGKEVRTKILYKWGYKPCFILNQIIFQNHVRKYMVSRKNNSNLDPWSLLVTKD